MNNILIWIGSIFVLTLGGLVWLKAERHVALPPQTTLPVAVHVATNSASTSPIHFIDAVGVVPSEITTGSTQPVTITVTISDPIVISNSVNVSQIGANGSSTILGVLQPAGNGTFI